MQPISMSKHLNQFGQTQFQLKFKLTRLQHIQDPVLVDDGKEIRAVPKFIKLKGGSGGMMMIPGGNNHAGSPTSGGAGTNMNGT